MMARTLVAGFGALIVCTGAWIFVEPHGLVQFAELILTPGGLWFAVVFRITVGVLLWLTAAHSRTPLAFRVLGVLIIASGIALPLVGLDRIVQVAEFGAGQNDWLLRGVGLLTAGVGAFLVWSIKPRRTES